MEKFEALSHKTDKEIKEGEKIAEEAIANSHDPAMLKEFEEDLHKHIHLENNILFKKAVELEKELCQ